MQLFSYNSFGDSCPLNVDVMDNCYWGNVALLFASGLLVTGPYMLIVTAVSAELSRHPSLKAIFYSRYIFTLVKRSSICEIQGSAKAMATVTAIIDGTGSIGATIGPFITGAVSGLDNGVNMAFYILIGADICAFIVSLFPTFQS